jgi:phosphopantothenoylcysteine decarboxylase/phosphopantothenate--cysteine ligase
MLRDRVVVVGVSGGIAAYKACELVRRLRERGAAVIVVMTPAACEFVTPLTFQALSGNPVVTTLWGDQKPRFEVPFESAARVGGKVEHVDVAEVADCVVVAPATADLMARMVHGEAPDALTCLLLATRAPLVLAPAMDLQMWRAAATRANVRVLRSRGARIVGPASGALASGLQGPGRLAEIADIAAEVERAVERRASLEGVRVLVGAGRTEEALDPVRVLTNRSSGRMGFALAEAARDRGADVTVVAGPVSAEPPHGVTLIPVTSGVEMQRAMNGAAAHADVVIMAAAVADYRPAAVAREKLKRSSARTTLDLVPNPDILAGLGAARVPGQVLVGFALETSNGVAHARAKLRAKGVDLVVLNAPADGIGGDTNRVTLVEAGSARALPLAGKRDVAEDILDRVIELRARTRAAAPKGRKATPAARRAATGRRKGRGR